MINRKLECLVGFALILTAISCQKSATKRSEKNSSAKASEALNETTDGNEMAYHFKPGVYAHNEESKLTGVCFAYTGEALKLNPKLRELEGFEEGRCPEEAVVDDYPDDSTQLIKACEPFGESDKIYGEINIYDLTVELESGRKVETSPKVAEKLCEDWVDFAELMLKQE